MKKTYPVEHGKETWKHLQEIARFGYSSSDVFSDFVEVCLSALLSFTDNLQHTDYKEFTDRLTQNKLSGVYEERYMGLVAKYKENKTRKPGQRPADYFKLAWNALQKETAEVQQDVLGEIYESQISLGEHGQFFTPPSVTDVMIQMLGPLQPGENVSNPACGSGRFFISMAKVNRDLHFHGVDVSPICARMAALNMWLFDLNADIYQGNSLSMEMSYVWRIRRGGFLWESKIDGAVALPPAIPIVVPENQAEALPVQEPLPKETPPMKAQPKPEAKKRKKKPVPKKHRAEQQTLFDLE